MSLYYLAGSVFSLAFGFPLAAAPALARALAGVVAEVASCDALRRMLVVVLGGSMGTVGARTDRGCREGPSLWGEGLSVLQWVVLRLRRVPSRTRRGIRGLPDEAGTAAGRGHEDDDLAEAGLDFLWLLRGLSPIFGVLQKIRANSRGYCFFSFVKKCKI